MYKVFKNYILERKYYVYLIIVVYKMVFVVFRDNDFYVLLILVL